nr:RNA-directed DNA polymerase, eukaryota [Tanacetum cinerariifolium]
MGVMGLAVEQAAASVGCTVMNPQFRYLGVTERITGKKNTWVAWNKVLVAKKHGGLGVSSYFAFNRALLLKWVWRFISNDGSLWCQTIRALYGQSIDSHPTKWSSNWCSILREVDHLKEQGFDFRDVRGGRESHQMETLNSLLASVSLSNSCDRWFCDLAGDVNSGSRRVNLARRGVHVDSSSCSLCDSNEEDVHHLFFCCDFALLILRRICTWWDLGVHDWSSFQECSTGHRVGKDVGGKQILFGKYQCCECRRVTSE